MQATQESPENSDEEDTSALLPGIPTHGAAAEILEKCVIWYEHKIKS